MRKGIGKIQAFRGKLPPNELRHEPIFDQFFKEYTECPNEGIFKSDGKCPKTTETILKKLAPKVNWSSEKAIVFFHREKSKLVRIIESELRKDEDRFFVNEEPDYVNSDMIEKRRRSFESSLGQYITVDLLAELNSCMETGASIKFERDVNRLLIRRFNFQLIDALKLNPNFADCLSAVLQKVLINDLENDLSSTTSLVCLNKSGIFWVAADVDNENSQTHFCSFDSVMECLSGKKRQLPTVDLTFDDDSKVSVHAGRLQRARELGSFFRISKNIYSMIDKTNKSTR